MKSIGFFFFLLTYSLFGQEDITLKNPSFEGTPQEGVVKGPAPSGWHNCGAPGESAPDIQPGFFNVYKTPSNGKTYLGLVIRDNSTWESISQKLERSLQANLNYLFKVNLAKSPNYLSPDRALTGTYTNHNNPAILRIWAGNSSCDKQELLTTSPEIAHTDWKDYSFLLRPQKEYNYLILEAYYNVSDLPYNGNLLLDNCSQLIYVPKEKVDSLNLSVNTIDKKENGKTYNLDSRVKEFENNHSITDQNFGEKIFELIDPIYEKEVDYLEQQLSKAFFLLCLNQHLSSKSKFQEYCEEYSFEQLTSTTQLLYSLYVKGNVIEDFNQLISILRRRENNQRISKKLKKIDHYELMEAVRQGLIENQIEEQIDSFIENNHITLLYQLYKATHQVK